MKALITAAVAASTLSVGAAAPAAAKPHCTCQAQSVRHVHKARHVVRRAVYRDYVSETAYVPPPPPPPPVTVVERETVFVRPRPVFVEPPPVYIRPRPVFVPAPPLYFRPRPVFVHRPVYFGPSYRHAWGPRIAYGGFGHGYGGGFGHGYGGGFGHGGWDRGGWGGHGGFHHGWR
jgi:hypothetical protein